MRRALVLVPQLILAAVAGVAVGLLWLATGDDGVGEGPPPAETVTAEGRFEPVTHSFGDTVIARVDVVVDSRSVQPDSIRVDADFAPYETVGPERVQRIDAGATSVVRFSYPLRCLREGCDPDGASGVIELETGRVMYRFRGQPGDAIEVLDWPPVQVTGRVGDAAVTDILWQADETALVAPSYRNDPVKTAAVLFVAALLLAALGAWLAWRFWRPRRAPAMDDIATASPVSPLERALDSARSASLNGDSALRRRALERVARELAAVGLYDLASDASVLAWGAGGSSGDDVDDLARRTLTALDNGGPR